jgi:polyhydroxyalkanoate synthase
MSWQSSQAYNPFGMPDGSTPIGQGTRPLAAMTAAVLAASQKPLVEDALRQYHAKLDEIPQDINWLDFQAGVTRYGNAVRPYVRPEYSLLRRVGRVSLRDAGGNGSPVVLIPSMVNRGYILDLCPGYSLVEALRMQGHHVLLIDWGDPTLPLTLDAIITEHLEPLLQYAATHFGPVAVFGYCMGGLLALAAGVRLGHLIVNKLAIAAMPWDFSVTTSASHMQQGRAILEPWVHSQNLIPPHILAHYFWILDPWSPIRRIITYGQETDPQRLIHLTALEDWLADGLALDAPIAREMLFDWYADNLPLKGEWKVDGRPITPDQLKVPLWVAITQNDLLVPTACSLPFVGQVRGSIQIHMAQTGHVGLVCGRKAKENLYTPLGNWLKQI